MPTTKSLTKRPNHLPAQPYRAVPVVRLLNPVTTITPLIKPRFDRRVLHDPPCVRVAGVLGYRLRQLEYAIAPDGSLRAWLLLCLRYFLTLAIPAFLLVPVLTLLFSAAATLSALLATILENILMALLFGIAIAVIGATLAVVFGAKNGRSTTRR